MNLKASFGLPFLLFLPYYFTLFLKGKPTMFKRTLAALALSTLSVSAFAQWTVNQTDSSISFVSVKKQHIAEAHHFNQFSGSIDKQGMFTLDIVLTSVDTGIGIRDQRMQKYLFNTDKFAVASISANVAKLKLASMSQGQTKSSVIEASLTISGMTKPQIVHVLLTKTSANSFSVSSAKPLIIKASDYLLVDGIDKLKDLAKLPSIGYSVPVTFTLNLHQ